MLPAFTPAHGAFRRELRDFLAAEVTPNLAGWDRAGELPVKELLSRMGALGFLRKHFPSHLGGEGLDVWYSVALHEELACLPAGSVGMLVASHLDISASLLARRGSGEVAAQWVTGAVRGEALLALALSEPHAGSDLKALSTCAERTVDGYRLQGHKRYITNAAQADGYIVLARTRPGDSPTAFSLFFVPRTLGGVEASGPLRTLGNRGTLGEVHFHAVELPTAYRLGAEGQGLLLQLEQFHHERTLIAVRMAAMARWHLERTIEHCRSRHTFGRPLLANQHIQFRLAELLARTEEVRSLVYRCVHLMAGGQRADHLAAMAKLAGSRLVREVADTCMQLHGGAGYLEEHLASRFFRDARGLSLAGGTDEMMLEMIGRQR